jgi:hypothetical protein
MTKHTPATIPTIQIASAIPLGIILAQSGRSGNQTIKRSTVTGPN